MMKSLDSGLNRNDVLEEFYTFNDIVKFDGILKSSFVTSNVRQSSFARLPITNLYPKEWAK